MKIKGRFIIDFLEAFKPIDTDKGYNTYLKIPNEMLRMWNMTGWKSCKIILFLLKDHYHFSLMPVYLFQNNTLLFVVFYLFYCICGVWLCATVCARVVLCVYFSAATRRNWAKTGNMKNKRKCVFPPLVYHKKPIFLIKLRLQQQSNISRK